MTEKERRHEQYKKYQSKQRELQEKGEKTRYEFMSEVRWNAMYDAIAERNESIRAGIKSGELSPSAARGIVTHISQEILRKASFTTGKEGLTIYRAYRDYIGTLNEAQKKELSTDPENAKLMKILEQGKASQAREFIDLLKKEEKYKKAVFDTLPKEEKRGKRGETIYETRLYDIKRT